MINNFLDAQYYGGRGGCSKSKRKLAALALNREKSRAVSGRKRTRSVAEILLRRKLTSDEKHAVGVAFINMPNDERALICRYFFGPKQRVQEYKNVSGYDPAHLRTRYRKVTTTVNWQNNIHIGHERETIQRKLPKPGPRTKIILKMWRWLSEARIAAF